MHVEKLVVVDGAAEDLGVLGPAADLLLVVVDLRVEQHLGHGHRFSELLPRKLERKREKNDTGVISRLFTSFFDTVNNAKCGCHFDKVGRKPMRVKIFFSPWDEISTQIEIDFGFEKVRWR